MINKILQVKKSFEKHGFEFNNFKDSKELHEFLLKDIDKETSLYFGGSKTLDDIGSFEKFDEKNYNVNWHWRKDVDINNNKENDKKYYITSSNALTEDGKLVNMDGVGNRVAAMITGYEKVYVVVGKNKLVKDVEEGRERIKNIAAPLNAKRLDMDTPCVKTGKCIDCNASDRICRAEVVLHRNPMNSNLVICYVEEDMGY